MMNKRARYSKMRMTQYSVNYLRMTNVYMDIWWALTFPGFGQWFQGKYFFGLVLIVWEFFINVQSHLNSAIFLSMHGRFEEAKLELDTRWFLLYIVIYIFAVWDTYYTGVQIKKRYVIASSQPQRLKHFTVGSLAVSFLERRLPFIPVVWSFMLPGAGHFILQRKFLSVFLIFWWILSCYMAGMPEAAILSLTGGHEDAAALLDPQWILFLPSLYLFAIYDSFVGVREINAFFEEEMADHLRKTEINADYQIPYPEAVLP